MKSLMSVSMLIFFLVISSVFGQEENRIHYDIRQAKNSNVHFENAIISEVKVDEYLLHPFLNSDEVFFFGNLSIDLKDNAPKAISLTLPLKNKNMVLELLEVPESFYNYYVVTSDGKDFSANREIKHYRGIVKDNKNSLVAITFYEDEIMGLVCTAEGNFNIVKDKQSGNHIFYNDRNLKEKIDFSCETKDDISVEYPSEILLQEQNNFIKQKSQETFQAINKEVRFYVETEYDIYQTRGSTTSVEAFISGLFNCVALLYYKEDILTSIFCMYIWKSNDPFTETNTTSLLSQFQSTRTSIIGDLGILLTFRDIGGGEAAGIDGLCNSDVKKKLSVAQLENYFDPRVNYYSWSVFVVTHELGHLFGSYHTHTCAWNGNNTAIDKCAGYVENKNGTIGSCSCLSPSIPPYGTIMSYCHWQSVGIYFYDGFGPQPGNVIRNNVTNASCLQFCNSPLNYIGQTVNQAIIINACGSINASSVTINNGGLLKLKAKENININSAVEAKQGSKLELESTGGSVKINDGFKTMEGATFIIK